VALTLAQRFSLKRFTQGEPSQQRQVELNHRRIFILPNKAGISLALVILLMLIASINYNNSLGFIFTFLLAAAAQTSAFYTYKNLSGLLISPAQSGPCFVGGQFFLNINIAEKNHRPRWQLAINYLDKQQVSNLAANEKTTLSLPITVNQRGWYTLQTITFNTSFPFGIVNAWSPLIFDNPVLVYPQAIDSGISFQLKAKDQTHNGISSNELGTDDFSGLKPYQTGQSYRHINWKALAAEKGLYNNEFSAEQSTDVYLDWESCNGLDPESKISQLCYWVLNCEKDGLSYGLRLPNVELLPSKGANHQALCLKQLALYEY